jgi:type I restriction enzyme M protein
MGFKQSASSPDMIEYKIGEIENKVRSGYNLRDIIEQIDELRFGTQTEKHELSQLYKAKIRNMGNAGRRGGEYTPRPLIRAMIEVVRPEIGQRIYDGAVGSAGFLSVSPSSTSRAAGDLTTADLEKLQSAPSLAKRRRASPT